MSAQIINGTQIASDIKNEVAAEVAALNAAGKYPCLAVVLVGDDPASAVYVGHKQKVCAETGIKSVTHTLPAETTEAELLALIDKLNEDTSVHGILVQSPVPAHIDESKILLAVSPDKDVDCFHPYNVGLMSVGGGTLLPGTPAGIIQLLKRSGIEIAGKNCVVLGRSNIVGKPIAMLLLREHGTITICHSKTENLAAVTKQADILIVAIRQPRFVTADMIKEGATVIDVGIHRLGGKKLCGDVDFESCKDVAGHITKVPGGVGPMTIAVLMQNCLAAYRLQNG